MKQSGKRKQPFITIAMRERKIIELFQSYLKRGHIHFRPRDKIYHFEIGARLDVLRTLELFLKVYPSKLKKMRSRIVKLQRVLNDYTPRHINKKVVHDIV